MKLMIPGPADVVSEDLLEMAQPLIPHYGDIFIKLWWSVQDGLKRVIGTTSDLIIVPGAGTAGTEMALCGFTNQRCIVVISGTFSKRMSEILKAHGASVIEVFVSPHQPATPELVCEALRNNPGVAGVCMVHSETSTGILHPVHDIARVVRETDALFVVDAVSSLGAVDFQMDESGIDICWTASQKALGGPPGLAIVAINRRAFDFFKSNSERISGWYLNPLVWKWYVENWDWHPYPTSLPTQLFTCLDKIIKRLLSEGLDKRYRKQMQASEAIRAGCKSLGFNLYAHDEKYASPTVTALMLPKNLDEYKFRNALVQNHNIMITGGYGELRGQVIRIGHMGRGIEFDYVFDTLNAMEQELIEFGIYCNSNRGNAIKAAASVKSKYH